jgi:signal transduction histidine kinase
VALSAAAVFAALVVVAAIAQQYVPHIQLTTQFAEVPRRLPVPLAVLFPLASVIAQLVALTRVSRWLERRNVGLGASFVVLLVVGASVCTLVSFASAAATAVIAVAWPARVLKGVIGGVEVCGLWMLAFRYPELLRESRARGIEIERARHAVERAQQAAELSRQAAELVRLREHLQPHFLRNTLNAIAALMDEAPSEAGELLAAVADLLTDSIEDSAPQRTLGAELAWLRRYGEILEARYRGSLRFVWEEAPTASAAMVPRLLLQPLVENAVYHGALARRTDGCVTVRTRPRPGGGTIAEVEDNGPGAPADNTSAIGLGLRLVRERVELESRGSFRLESGAHGTRAIVELP